MAVYDVANRRLICAMDMPVEKDIKGRKQKRYIPAPKVYNWLADWIAEYGVVGIAIEQVASSPQMGVTSAFSFGEGFGIVKAAAETLHPNVQYVHPSVWKPRMSLNQDKKTSVDRARELFGTSPWFTRVSKDGPAEAALLAIYGAKNLFDIPVDPLS